MPSAFVTGAAGFTGRYVVRALSKRGYQVYSAGLGAASLDNWIACDLTDKAQTAQAVRHVMPDLVVHLAGMAFVAGDHPEDFYRVNVFGTLNLLEALAATKYLPSKVLIASSANVYGNTPGELTETTCPAPVNHYGASKLAMECMVKTWFDRLPIIITRPFNYTGPGQDERFIIPKIVSHFRRRESSIKLGDTSVERDFSDVEDVVEAYLRLLESSVQAEIVNICSGRTSSVASIIAEMNTIAGYEIRVETDASLLRRNELPALLGSNKKLHSLTAFVPDKPIQETVRQMYAAK